MNQSTLHISAVGDICPGEHYFSIGHGVLSQFRNGNLQKSLAFLKDELSGADIVFGNLEGVISSYSKHKNPIESRAFRGDPNFAIWLKELGFSHISIANNHFLQHGHEAALDSIQALLSAGITPVGRRDQTDKWLCLPEYVLREKKTAGILAYSLVPERYEPRQSIYAEATDWERIENDIRLLSKEVKCVIVSLHGGDEGLFQPNQEMVNLCDQIYAAGANVILGHHSHTLQGIKKDHNSVTFYSLGNFIFDMDWDKRFGRTAIANISFDIGCSTLTHSMTPYNYYNSKLTQASSIGDTSDSPPHPNYLRELSAFERSNQIRKAYFFIKNLLRGDTGLKIRFITSKFKKNRAPAEKPWH